MSRPPRQHREVIPVPFGRKYRKGNGTWRRTGRSPRLADQRMGSYGGPVRRIDDPRPPLQECRLGFSAWQLVRQYLARTQFVLLLEAGATVELAGQTALGCKRSQSHRVNNDLSQYDNPEAWFAARALQAMNRGEIARGRQTRRCPRADVFFAILGGGDDGKDHWRYKLAGRSKIDLAELDPEREEAGEAPSEALDYWVHTGSLWERVT